MEIFEQIVGPLKLHRMEYVAPVSKRKEMHCLATVIVTLGSHKVMTLADCGSPEPHQSSVARPRRSVSGTWGLACPALLWALGQSTPQWPSRSHLGQGLGELSGSRACSGPVSGLPTF